MTDRKYYYMKSGNFSNEYSLAWGAFPDAPEGLERITRKTAIALCTAEKERRRQNPDFAFHAPTQIFRYGATVYEMAMARQHGESDYIVE